MYIAWGAVVDVWTRGLVAAHLWTRALVECIYALIIHYSLILTQAPPLLSITFSFYSIRTAPRGLGISVLTAHVQLLPRHVRCTVNSSSERVQLIPTRVQLIPLITARR
jgi:hypothetical protein